MDQEAIDKLTEFGMRLAALSEHATCPDCRALASLLGQMLMTTVEVAVKEAFGPIQGESS